MCFFTLFQPDAPFASANLQQILNSPGFFYWPGGNSEAKAGQEMDDYRQDMDNVGWNVIHVSTAWKMPVPSGVIAEEDFLTGVHKYSIGMVAPLKKKKKSILLLTNMPLW